MSMGVGLTSYRWVKRGILAVAAVGTVLLVAVLAPGARGAGGKGEGDSGTGPSSGPFGLGITPGTLQVEERLMVDGLEWSLVSYDSPDGRCLDVWVADGTGEIVGAQSGCGTGRPFHWSVGGMEVDGRWYDVHYGGAVPGATRVILTMEDGSRSSTEVKAGAWLVVAPGDPQVSVSRIDLVDTVGRVLADVSPPSLATLRAQAVEALARRGD